MTVARKFLLPRSSRSNCYQLQGSFRQSQTKQDVEIENRYIYIHHSKTGETKPVPILDENVALFKKITPGFPKSYFFRHDDSKSGVKIGQKFGEKYFYKWWKRACENIGIEGVDLYGGTRHSSAVALRKDFSPEQIKQGTMHQTNKAFERYFRIGADDIREIYQQSSGNNKKQALKLNKIKSKVNK